MIWFFKKPPACMEEKKDMLCPYCHTDNNGVKDSRPGKKNRTIRRRRHCNNCHIRFSTVEWVEHKEIAVCKRNGETEPFDFDKLTRSLNTALRKRRVDRKHIDLIVASIHQQLQGSIENEITSETIGKLVMANLAELDKVAFVRFASVYQNFNKVEDFERFAGAVRTEYPI